MVNYEKAVDRVYDELNNCIILGLTGRTGSGCTTTSQILNIEKFDDLNLPTPKQRDFLNKEERKYAIIYKYMKKNWKPFTAIEASSIIISFIFGKSFKDFEDFLHSLANGNDTHKFRISGESELFKKVKGIKGFFNNTKFTNIDENIEEILKDSKLVKAYYNYYIIDLKKQKNIFYSVFKDFSCFESFKSTFSNSSEQKSHLYTYLMQMLGNNLRSSGDPYVPNFNQKSFFSIAERINNVVRIVRKHNENNSNPTRICIDALRNPYEAFFLRDLHKSFYLVSVSTDDEERKRRLSNLDANELLSLDHMEYPSKEYESGQVFFQQSISECLQIADIHLYNPQEKNDRYEFLTRNLVRYIALMLHPGLITPTDIERCMQIAYNAKLNSGCLSRQVGSVITDEKYYIKAIGWNDVPQGQIPCNLRCIQNYFSENDCNTFSDFELNNSDFCSALNNINQLYLSSTNSILEKYNIPFCFKDIYNSMKNDKNQVYTRSLHAEENAFLQLSKFGGQGIKGGKLFVTASPCELCSKKSYQLGIKEIYYIDPYPGIASSHILKIGNNPNNPKLNLFYGAIGNAYVSLYSQRFAYKDELQLSSGIKMKEAAKPRTIIPQFEYNDIIFENVSLELIFINRSEIEFIQNVTVIPQKEGVTAIDKAISWTGSTYINTIINNPDESYEIANEFCSDGVNYYTIKPKKALKKGNAFTYNVKTLVNDEREIMNPILSYHARSKTNTLEMKIKFNKDTFTESEPIENVVVNEYADINKNIIFKTEEVKKDISEKYIEYSKCLNNINLFYAYAIEWDFKKKLD